MISSLVKSVTFVSLIILFSALVLVFSFLTAKLLIANYRYRKTKGPFKNCYKLPGLMPMIDLFSPDSFKRYLDRVVDKEGNLIHKVTFIGAHINGNATLFVNDTNYFKDLLTVEKCPKLEIIYDGLKVMLGDGLATSSGALWKRQRRLLTPIFHFQNLKQMPAIMIKNVKQMCQTLQDKNGTEQLAVHVFSELTLSIVIDCVFGGEEFLSTHKMAHLWDAANKAMGTHFISLLFLGPFLHSVVPFNKTMDKAMKEIKGFVTEAIAKKRKQIASGSYTDDLMSALLTVVDTETGKPIPDSLIQDECLTFLFAGHDTTSSLLSWCVSFLAHDSRVVKKLREEIEDVLGEREFPEYDDIQQFQYCKMVLHETLRMRPPVPALDRRTAEPLTIEGIDVPVGTYIDPLILAAHYDNRYWKQPFEFRPERWDPANKDTEPERHPYSFVPFSAGTRNCIGQKFSIMEAVLVLVVLVRKFDVETKQSLDDIIWDTEGTLKPVNFKCSFVPINN